MSTCGNINSNSLTNLIYARIIFSFAFFRIHFAGHSGELMRFSGILILFRALYLSVQHLMSLCHSAIQNAYGHLLFASCARLHYALDVHAVDCISDCTRYFRISHRHKIIISDKKNVGGNASGSGRAKSIKTIKLGKCFFAFVSDNL